MRRYVDHVLALLPFEPGEYRRLSGPHCTYVGHPVCEEIALLRPNRDELQLRERSPSTLLVMPGSRESEVRRLMPIFGTALARLHAAHRLEIVLPTLPHLQDMLQTQAQKWSVEPRIITDARDKYASMRRARAALVASGTATLELALAQIPMVVAYRVSLIEEFMARSMLRIDKIALPNLVLGRHAVPECVQAECSAEALAEALAPLLAGGAQREAQLSAFEELASLMKVDAQAELPSSRAAQIVQAIAEGTDSCGVKPS